MHDYFAFSNYADDYFPGTLPFTVLTNFTVLWFDIDTGPKISLMRHRLWLKLFEAVVLRNVCFWTQCNIEKHLLFRVITLHSAT